MALSRKDTQLTGPALENYYSKNSALAYEKARSKKLSDIFANPADYHAQRTEAIEQVIKNSDAAFVNLFNKLINDEVPEADAIVRAKRHADAVKASLLLEVDTEWPTDLQNLASSLAYAKGPAANTGFVKPEEAKKTRRSKK